MSTTELQTQAAEERAAGLCEALLEKGGLPEHFRSEDLEVIRRIYTIAYFDGYIDASRAFADAIKVRIVE